MRGEGRIPGGGEGGIAVPQGIGGLAAHAGASGGEGDRPAGGEGDNEGNSLGIGPFAGPARAAGSGQIGQGISPAGEHGGKHRAGAVGQGNRAETRLCS